VFEQAQNAQIAAAITLSDDPVAKLRAFLAANPDVATLIEDYEPPEPEPNPQAGLPLSDES
jgi:hypothetical protein